MKFSVFESSPDMARILQARIEYGDFMHGMATKIYERFIDYVARYCAKHYIKEHSVALQQLTSQEMVSRRVRAALRVALQEK